MLLQIIDTETYVILLAILIAIVGVGPLMLRFLLQRSVDPFEPAIIFVIFYIISFTFRPLFVLSNPTTSLVPLRVSDMAVVLFFALVGIICFTIGYYVRWRSKLQNYSVQVYREVRWSSRRVTHIAVIVTFLCAISLMVIFTEIGLYNIIERLGRLRRLLEGYHYFSLGKVWLGTVALLLWIDYRLFGKHFFTAISLLIVSTVLELATGGRYQIIYLWLSFLLIENYMKARNVRQWFVGIITVSSILIVTLSVGASRHVKIGMGIDYANTIILQLKGISDILIESIMSEFNQFDAFVVYYDITPNIMPWLFGSSYFHLLIQPIPRLLWPGKPYVYTIEFGRYLLGPDIGIPPTMVGELYINFHIIGIFVGMFLFGRLCRVVYSKFISRSGNPCAVIVYALFLSNIPLFMLRSFVTSSTAFLILLVPTLAALKYITYGSSLFRSN